MFERFTNRARRIVVVAQDTAREMGHSHIQPEHMLVGLRSGDGLAAQAMAELGVDENKLRERVAGTYDVDEAAKRADRVPFSKEAKRCLELALRAALKLGHNYIGTEHLFLGVQRQAEQIKRPIDPLLGVSATEIENLLMEMLSSGAAVAGRADQSPALVAALKKARTDARPSAVTTAHLLAAMLADPNSHVSRALAGLDLDATRVQAALDAVDPAETSDATPTPKTLTIQIGDQIRVVTDADVIAALQQLGPDELDALLRTLVDKPDPGSSAAG